MTTNVSTDFIDRETNRLLRLARRAWYPAFSVALGIFVTSIPGYIFLAPRGFDTSIKLIPTSSPLLLTLNILAGIFSVIIVLLSFYLALILFRHRPDDRMALFLSFYLLAFAVLAAGPFEALQIYLSGIAIQISQSIVVFIMLPLSIFLFGLFPDGRFVPDWTRWLGVASIVVVLLMLTFPSIGYLLMFFFLFSMLYAQIYRFRHVSNWQQQQQTKWFVYGLGMLIALLVMVSIPITWSHTLPLGAADPLWEAGAQLLYFASFALIPVTLTISVMRYRLYDIDILINRTLVYGVLTALVIMIYVLTVGLVGTAFQSSSDLVGILLTTILVVLLFKPLKDFLQRVADQMIPGSKEHSIPTPSQSSDEYPEPLSVRDDLRPLPQASLNRGWLLFLNSAWYLAAAASLVIFIASIPGFISLISKGFYDERFTINPSSLVLAFNVLFVLLSIASVLVSLYIALLLFRRSSETRIALLLSFYLLAHGIMGSGPLEMLEPILPGVARLNYSVLLPILVFPLMYVLLTVFPDGRFVPGWTRWGMIAVFMAAPVFFFLTYSLTTYQPDFSDPLILTAIVLTVLLTISLFFSLMYAQFYRYKYVSSQKQRQQTKWILYGIGMWFTIVVIGSIFWFHSYSLPPGTPFPWWLAAFQALWGFSTTIFPISLAIAVLRYQLFDIDILINRTLVYGVLTVTTMGIYVIAVGYFGNIFQAQDSTLIAFLITGLVALLFHPLRERMQRVVNRLMYGERDDPLAVLKKMGQQLEETTTPNLALTGIVKTVAQTLKLPYVAIVTIQNEEREVSAHFGESQNERLEIPLIYQSARIGYLVIAKRGGNEDFNPKEISLLENIARQASNTVYSVRLMADLRRSRQHLVTAREEERRRLRRDLHDGLGASLAALHIQTGAIQRAIENDPELAKSMVAEFKLELHEAIADIRRVAYELRPPALDELGLTAALHALTSRFNKPTMHDKDDNPHQSDEKPDLDVQIEVPENLPQLPAAVEVAVYRIVQEALTNVINHSEANSCLVNLNLDQDLHLEILDDGIGISPDQPWGVGLSSMCERAIELGGTCVIEPAAGGGTRVFARFPVLSEKSA